MEGANPPPLHGMKTLVSILLSHPLVAGEILLATLMITVLNLAAPLYAMVILNRYVSSGFTGTLLTLTAGMVLVIVFQLAIRVLRTKLVTGIFTEPGRQLAAKAAAILAGARMEQLMRLDRGKIQEIFSSIQQQNRLVDASNVNAILDTPFVVLYIAAIWFLSQILALVTMVCMVLVWIVGKVATIHSTKKGLELQQQTLKYRSDQNSAIENSETVRAFRGKSFLARTMGNHIAALSRLTHSMADSRELSHSLTLAGTTVMTVAVYAIGSSHVVDGTLSIGALIGTSILASRAVAVISRFVQVQEQMSGLKKSEQDIAAFLSLPLERESGTAIRTYAGRIETRDLAFAWPGQSQPLFESLNLSLSPGDVLAVVGYNGAGKTTLARLLAGLLFPIRGRIMIDGINLAQIAPDWWRRQIIYVPQEPTFLRATILQNITLARPDIDPAELNRIIAATNLRPFLDESVEGLETVLHDSGDHLPLGIRRRLALARGLVTNGSLVILDEPTEGLDPAGCHALYGLLNTLAKAGKTIVVCTQDEKILRGARTVLDLSVKPVPQVSDR